MSRRGQIQVGGFREIAIASQVLDGRDVATPVGVELIVRIAPENLRGALQDDLLGSGEDAAERHARVVNPILPTHQVLGHQRTIGPGQHMVMQSVYFSEGGAHFANPQVQAAAQCGKRELTLFEIDALFAEADEEVGTRVRIEDGLKSNLALMHLKRWSGPVRSIPNRA